MYLRHILAEIAVVILVPSLFFWGWAMCIRRNVNLRELFLYLTVCAATMSLGAWLLRY